MAPANGYIIDKEFQKEIDNFQVSMDISYDNRTLAFGYGPMLKLVTINTNDSNYWFQDKKTLGRLSIYSNHLNQKIPIPNSLKVFRDIKWNCCDLGRNLVGVAMGESAFAYDVEDKQTSRNPEGFIRVFQTGDVMRQGDYPTKFIWYPNSKDLFLCTSSKSQQIVMCDLRLGKEHIVKKFNDSNNQSRSQQKIEDLKFNPTNENYFATITKNSTISIFDIRIPRQSIIKKENIIQNYKSNLLDWQFNGKNLASVFGGIIKIWGFNGSQLIQKESFEHKNAISDMKWLKKNFDYLLVSEMQENIVFRYSISEKKHDLEILVDPRHSGLKKFITDRNQQLVLGITNFEDSKKYHHEMIAVFIEYHQEKQSKKSDLKNQSQPLIWSESKFKKPNAFGLDNQLLFATKADLRKGCNSFAAIFKEIQSSARRIDVENESEQTLQNKRIRQLALKEREKKLQKIRSLKKEHKILKEKVKQFRKVHSHTHFMPQHKQYPSRQEEQDQKSIKSRDKHSRVRQKVRKLSSVQENVNIRAKPKNRSVQKIQKEFESNSNSSDISSNKDFDSDLIIEKQWILSYREQVNYLNKHYKIEINEHISEQKGQNICKHNSKVALSIGKTKCAEFWRYIYYFAFPEPEDKYTISTLYEDKVKPDVFFKENKIFVSCENKSQIIKKQNKYSIQKLIQNLVDDNQLQTAVMACIMIRNKNPHLISLQFLQPFLECFQQVLQSMGQTFISTNLSYIAKLNKAVQTMSVRFQIPIGCGLCYKKFSQCKCIQVCALCGDPIKSKLVLACKICGHMFHAKQLEQRLLKQNIAKCPYENCDHECFKI